MKHAIAGMRYTTNAMKSTIIERKYVFTKRELRIAELKLTIVQIQYASTDLGTSISMESHDFGCLEFCTNQDFVLPKFLGNQEFGISRFLCESGLYV